MRFEGEEAPGQRFTGTIVGSENLDQLWPESSWRSLKVRWDEPSTIPRPDRVSPWETNVLAPSPESSVLTKEGATKVDVDSAQAQRNQNNMFLQGLEHMTLRTNNLTDSNDSDATIQNPMMWSPSPNIGKNHPLTFQQTLIGKCLPSLVSQIVSAASPATSSSPSGRNWDGTRWRLTDASPFSATAAGNRRRIRRPRCFPGCPETPSSSTTPRLPSTTLLSTTPSSATSPLLPSFQASRADFLSHISPIFLYLIFALDIAAAAR